MENKTEELKQKLELCKSFEFELKFPFVDSFDQTISKLKVSRPTWDDVENAQKKEQDNKSILRSFIASCSKLDYETLGKMDYFDVQRLEEAYNKNFPSYQGNSSD